MGQTWKSRVPKFYRMLLVTEVHELHSNSFGLILFSYINFIQSLGYCYFFFSHLVQSLSLSVSVKSSQAFPGLFLNIVTLQASECSCQYYIALVFRSHGGHFHYHLFWFFEKCTAYADSSLQTSIQGQQNNNALCSCSLLPLPRQQKVCSQRIGFLLWWFLLLYHTTAPKCMWMCSVSCGYPPLASASPSSRASSNLPLPLSATKPFFLVSIFIPPPLPSSSAQVPFTFYMPDWE